MYHISKEDGMNERRFWCIINPKCLAYQPRSLVPRISLDELYRRTGVSPNITSQLENGKRPQVAFDTIVRLAKELDISLDEVMAEDHAY